MPADTGTDIATVRPAPIVAFNELQKMAEAFAQSGMFGAKTPAQALSLLMLAQAEGMHPSLAMQEYDIIEGKPARKSERIQARFQMSGGRIEFLAMSDKECEARFTHPQGSDVTVKWTIEQAAKITYYTKDGWKSLATKANWKNYPRAMLKARVISEGCKASFPGYALVTLSTEEALDGGTLTSQAIDVLDDPITEAQAEQLRALIDETGADIAKFCKYLEIEAIPDMRQRDFPNAVEALNRKRKTKPDDGDAA